MNHQIIETAEEQALRVVSQQHKVYAAMIKGSIYHADDLATLTGLPVTRVRTSLKALLKMGLVLRDDNGVGNLWLSLGAL
jgi:predicted transcriptional regulator